MTEPDTINQQLFSAIKNIVEQAKEVAYRSNNVILVNMYWEIGKLIAEDEQGGNAKAAYGKAVLKNLSQQLTPEFGKGFDDSNLRNIRQFYLSFQIRDAVRHELSWTHYRIISRVEKESLRLQYIKYCIEGNWDTRTLQRNINTHYITRIVNNHPQQISTAGDIVKDPYLVEFIAATLCTPYNERKLEDSLIVHLQYFLMELGKGFAFVARQQHIVTDTADFFIDLVFYNYYLKYFCVNRFKNESAYPCGHRANGYACSYVQRFKER